ncbi:hypothetical protein [Oceanobacillus caeni]
MDVFHASSYFDGWTLTDHGDFYIFSMHGGSIAYVKESNLRSKSISYF